ncbi:MAG: lamin tail domain-containing protein [Deltaproteobacteria bacterium]|nr:lamin tail domain-containing protein [Deltaproteobacteria bacterium]
MTKTFARWIGVAAALALGGCSLINHSQTHCKTNAECTGDAVCNSDGVCEVPAGRDASVPIPPDAGQPDAGPPGLVLAVETSPTAVAGMPASVTVTAKDSQGNRLTAYIGTVRVTSTDTRASLPAPYVFLPADQGSKVFNNVIFQTAGAWTITATDTATLVSGQASVSVEPALAAGLKVSVQPLTVVAGAKAAVTVEAQDAFGNTASGYVGSIRFTSDDEDAVLPTDYTFTSADLGVHVFTEGVEFHTSGTRSLTAADVAQGSRNGTQSDITVLPGPAEALQVSGVPSELDAGTRASVNVRALDGFGNAVTGYVGTIHFECNGCNATLPDDYHFLAEDNGNKTFTNEVILRAPGTWSLAATDLADESITGAQPNITVRLGPPAQLGFLQAPLAAQTNVVFAQTQVAIQDAGGNTLPTSTNTVTIRLGATTSGAALHGTLSVDAENGVARFDDLLIDLQGSGYTLVAASGNLVEAETDPFDVSGCQVGYTGPSCEECIPSFHRPVGEPTVCVSFCEQPMPCTNPPTKTCDGNVSVSYGDGACTPTAASPYFTCDYSGNTTHTNCAATSQICDPSTGECVADPCDTDPCEVPEADCSADHVTLSTYAVDCTPIDATQRECTPRVASTVNCSLIAGQVCLNQGCEAVAAPVAQDLLITEVMANPSVADEARKWIEIRNLSDHRLNLAGLVLEEATGTVKTFTLPSTPLLVDSGDYFVIGGSIDPLQNGGAAVDLAWESPFTIAAAAGDLSIKSGSDVLEHLVWDARFPSDSGEAMNLSSRLLVKGVSEHPWYWCGATDFIAGGSGDKGTPGGANAPCSMPVAASLTWCNAQRIDPAAVAALLPIASYGRFYGAGVTDQNSQGNDLYPFVVAEMGWGADNDATGWTTWAPATFNDVWAPTAGLDLGRDEMKRTLIFPAAGTFAWAFRYALKDPVSGQQGNWTYCGAADIASTPTAGPWASIVVSHTAESTNLQLGAFVAAVDGTVSLPVAGALVTYVKPGGGSGNDGPGFFVQAKLSGPALFVAVDPATLSPVPAVGDEVAFTVTLKATQDGLAQVAALSDWSRSSAGHDVAPLAQDASSASDLASGIATWQSRLIDLTAEVQADFAPEVGAFLIAPITTAGYLAPDANLRLRMPYQLVYQYDLVPACTVAIEKTPLWRSGATAQPSAWTAADFSVSGCPAPRVVTAKARSNNSFVVVFDRNLAPASVLADGSQFAVTPAVGVNGAVASGREVLVTTASTIDEVAGSFPASYTVSVSASLEDTAGGGVDPAANAASFEGTGLGGSGCFLDVFINQVFAGGGEEGAPLKSDFVELHNRSISAAIDLSTWSLQTGKTGADWQVTPLNGSIPPGGFLLIRLASSGTSGADLVSIDFNSTAALDVTGGKLILATTQTVFTEACPTGADVVDLVGFGATDCFEGTAASPLATFSALRRPGDCMDAVTNNSQEFVLQPPAPRSSVSVPVGCGCD